MDENELFPFSFSLDKIRHKDHPLYSELLKILLLDRSRKRNIIWATDAYKGRDWESPVCQSSVSAIRPRAFKEDAEKQARVKTHAEVFTPFEVVSQMTETLWEEPEGRDKTYLEIACGEAPFITSRYDTATGNPIPLEKRIGILDRKLQQTEKAAEGDEDWIEKAEAALKSVYGYEFQGDSLFIARVNVLDAFLENFVARFHRLCDRDLLLKEANIVSWNFWQMDGRTLTPPDKDNAAVTESNLFQQGTPCRIRFWNQNTVTHFNTEKGRGMKRFYAIIGNPPYQSEKNGGGANFHASIYPQFMEQAFKIADKVELITPARFLSGAGRTGKDWNERILNNPHFQVLEWEPNAKNIFPDPNLKGGVCISLWDKEKITTSPLPLTPFAKLNSICKKVKKYGEASIQDIYFSCTKFNLPNLYRRFPGIEDQIKTDNVTLGTRIFDLPIWSETKNEGDATVLGLMQKKRRILYIDKSCLLQDENFNFYKVIFPRANGSGSLGETLSTPVMGTPVMGYTDTFRSFGAFNEKYEAEACLKYIKSKFARCMLGVKKTTQHNTKVAWEFVPLQDFTSNSDIDWTQSISDIDQQLYGKYGLSEDEIQFIESNVKEMK